MFAKSKKIVCYLNPPHHTLEKPPLPLRGHVAFFLLLRPHPRRPPGMSPSLSGCLTTLSRLS